jgi:hypothetical protein
VSFGLWSAYANKVIYAVAVGAALSRSNSSATAYSTTVPLKKPGLLRVDSMAALVGLIERIEEPHSLAFKVVHIPSD